MIELHFFLERQSRINADFFPHHTMRCAAICISGDKGKTIIAVLISLKVSLRSSSVFLANSWPSRLVMPFEMFSFPSVSSDRWKYNKKPVNISCRFLHRMPTGSFFTWMFSAQPAHVAPFYGFVAVSRTAATPRNRAAAKETYKQQGNYPYTTSGLGTAVPRNTGIS